MTLYDAQRTGCYGDDRGEKVVVGRFLTSILAAALVLALGLAIVALTAAADRLPSERPIATKSM